MRQDTLLYVIDRLHNRVLLGMKKTKFGAGNYNAPGGQVDPGETPEQAAVRETLEEIGVVVVLEDITKFAEIHFSFESKPEWERMVHVYCAERWSGEPTESKEMRPEWFSLDAIPYDKMWIDDIHWMPQVLKGERIKAEFHFNADASQILKQDVRSFD